jgi:hypothetical protein
MKHDKEFDTNYFHNSHVQGVNYSLFIMLLKDDVDGLKGATGSVSPPILAVFRSVLCVSGFSTAPT